MTIKRYKPVPRMEYKVFSCPPIHCAGMDESAKGGYVHIGDLRERLEDMLSQCQYTPEAFSHEIRTLIEELK